MKEHIQHLFGLQGLVVKDEGNAVTHYFQPTSAVENWTTLTHNGHWYKKRDLKCFRGYHLHVFIMLFIVSQFNTGHTNRLPSRDNTLPLRTCHIRCAAVLCYTLLHYSLHLFLIQKGERYLVDPHVGSLWWPRQFLECHMRIWVLLQNMSQRWACITKIHSYTDREYKANMLVIPHWRCTVCAVRLKKSMTEEMYWSLTFLYSCSESSLMCFCNLAGLTSSSLKLSISKATSYQTQPLNKWTINK